MGTAALDNILFLMGPGPSGGPSQVSSKPTGVSAEDDIWGGLAGPVEGTGRGDFKSILAASQARGEDKGVSADEEQMAQQADNDGTSSDVAGPGQADEADWKGDTIVAAGKGRADGEESAVDGVEGDGGLMGIAAGGWPGVVAVERLIGLVEEKSGGDEGKSAEVLAGVGERLQMRFGFQQGQVVEGQQQGEAGLVGLDAGRVMVAGDSQTDGQAEQVLVQTAGVAEGIDGQGQAAKTEDAGQMGGVTGGSQVIVTAGVVDNKGIDAVLSEVQQVEGSAGQQVVDVEKMDITGGSDGGDAGDMTGAANGDRAVGHIVDGMFNTGGSKRGQVEGKPGSPELSDTGQINVTGQIVGSQVEDGSRGNGSDGLSGSMGSAGDTAGQVQGAGAERLWQSDGLYQQISGVVRESVRRGEGEITVELRPAELGRVFIRLQQDEGQLSVQLQFSKEQTRIEAEHLVPQVVRSLQAVGIVVRRFEVVSDQTGERTGQDQAGLSGGVDYYNGGGMDQQREQLGGDGQVHSQGLFVYDWAVGGQKDMDGQMIGSVSDELVDVLV